MKKITTLIILALVIQTQVSSQSCLPYGININTQEEIDNFQTNYPDCTEIEGSVMISDQSTNNITNLSGLSFITSIGGYLVIYENNALHNLSGLDNLTSVGGNIEIENNATLSDISAFNSMTTIGGDLQINNNVLLLSLQGLNSVNSVSGFVKIYSNESLQNISALNSLSSVGSTLMINGNNQLATIDGLENIETIGESLIIAANALITNLNGLENIEIVNENLIISGNTMLTNLNGLNNLTSVGADLYIRYNDALVSIQGLESVTSINGRIYIKENKILSSLEGLDNIYSGSIDELSILLNDSLSTCEVKSICDYLSHATGYINIAGNAAGCNNEEEVIEACVVGILNKKEPEIIIYPNPAKNSITISSTNGKSIDLVRIYNQLGQIVLSKSDLTDNIDVAKLDEGIYIIEIGSSELTKWEKLVIKE